MQVSSRPRPWLPPRSAFAGFRFPPEVIVVAVRWYLRFNLSYRDVEELSVERRVEVDHVTVYTHTCAPQPDWEISNAAGMALARAALAYARASSIAAGPSKSATRK